MTYTEVFDCGVGLPMLGAFEVRFRPGSATALLGPHVASTGNGDREGPTRNWEHDTLVITPGRLSPGADRATVLDAAIYAGEILRFRATSGGGWTISGCNATLNWLGDTDNKGPGVCAGTDYTTGAGAYTGSVPDYLLALTVAGLTNGITLDATAASIDTSALNCAIRDMDVTRARINQICRAKSVEYWPFPDFSVVFAGAGDTTDDLFQWTPKVLFADGVGYSRESGMVSFPCEILPELDVGTDATTLQARNSDGTGTYGESPGSAILPNDTTGAGTGVRGKFMGASDELMEQGFAGDLERYRRTDSIEIRLDSRTVRYDLKPGDHVYVQSHEWGLIGTTALVHTGRSLAPVRRRVSEMTTPITRENGVYVLHNVSSYGGVNAVQDVAEQVLPDMGACTVRIAAGSPQTLRRAILGSQTRPRWDQA